MKQTYCTFGYFHKIRGSNHGKYALYIEHRNGVLEHPVKANVASVQCLPGYKFS
jgi:hypothetical protein